MSKCPVCLKVLIQEYDDGKAKSFFCLATALLEMDELNEAMFQINVIRGHLIDKKRLAKQAKSIIEQSAQLKGVDLIYGREKV